MTPLSETIAALRRELDTLLAARDDQGHVRLRRVRITLGLAHHPDPIASPWSLAAQPSPHSVTFEWETAGPASGDACESARQDPSPAPGMSVPDDGGWDDARAQLVGSRLDEVFGPPGFDAAARASVFRELALEAGASGIDTALSAITAGGPELGDATLERARHGIRRLLDRGPAGSRDGARILRDIFAHHPFHRVLDVVESRWRFG